VGERVFISHGDADRDYVLRLVEYLAQAGIGSDNHADSAGQRVDAHAQQQIDDCGAFIVVMSPESLSSASVNNDMYVARSRGKTVLPVLLRGEAFVTLRNTGYFDSTDGRMPDEAFVRRLRAALDLASGPADSASVPAAAPMAPLSVPAPPTVSMATLPAAAQFVSVGEPLAPAAAEATVPAPAYQPPPAPPAATYPPAAEYPPPGGYPEQPVPPPGGYPVPPPSGYPPEYPPAPGQPPAPPYPGLPYPPPVSRCLRRAMAGCRRSTPCRGSTRYPDRRQRSASG
jgi:hypothetical protein